MTLSLLTRKEAVSRMNKRAANEVGSAETLSDLLRAEIHARRHAPRSTTLLRVARLLSPAVDVAEGQLEEICDVLEREGDLVLAPGGILHSTPTRVVLLGDRARVLSSVPTSVLAEALGREVNAEGATRSTASTVGIAEAVAAIDGAVVTPEMWAGLDHAPIANGAFLESLDRRLEWESMAAGSMETDGPLDWRAWQVTDDGLRWRRSDAGRLWWARTRFGGNVRVWTSGEAPASCPFIHLSAEDADRARFAIASDSSAPLHGTRVSRDGRVQLTLPSFLPRSEYRYVSLLASQLFFEKRERVWVTSSTDVPTLCAVLSERLGIQWQGDAGDGGGHRRDAAVTVPGTHGTQEEIVVQAASDAPEPPMWVPPNPLEELVQASGISLLLSQLGVRTYGDLFGLDLQAARERPGVGPTRFAMLLDMVAEAKRRSGWRPESVPLQQPRAPEPAPPSYDSWLVVDALGRLPVRVKGVLDTHNIQTIGQLKALVTESTVERKERLGPSTRAEIVSLIDRLERDGHETLVFGGAPPQSIAEFAERYIAQTSENVREIAELWWAHGWTLQRIADARGISRERVRQLRNAEIERTAPGWRDRARSLLAPIVNAIEERGNIASTRILDGLYHSQAQWTMDLAAEIGQLTLKWNVRPGIATVLSDEAFEELEKDLRDACEDHPTTVMELDELRALLFDRGLRTPEQEIADVVVAMLRVTIDGNSAFLSRRTTAAAYVSIVRDAGVPIAAKEVARRLSEVDPTLQPTARSAVVSLRRSPEVLSAGHGLWVHHDHLGFPRALLNELAARCLPIVQAAAGQAVNVRTLLSGLVAERVAPESMTALMLRDALLHTGKVRAWRAGADVAWLGGDVARMSILEWAKEVAIELDPPFSLNELVEEVARRSGNLPNSILVQVKGLLDDLIPVGGARYISRAATWSGDEDYFASMQCMRDALQGESLWSAESDKLTVPGIEHLTSEFGRGIIYGLATRDPEFRSRAAGLLMWRRASGERVWDVMGTAFFSSRGMLITGTSLRDYLASACGAMSYQLASRLIAEGLESGILIRLGLGWYMPSHLSSEQQMEALAAQPDIFRLTLSSQDFVRESPARELLNDLRALHGQFRVPAG